MSSKIPSGFRGKLIWDEDLQDLVPFLKEKEKKSKVLVKTDEIEPTQSAASPHKEVFTSKKKLLRHYKDNGYVCTEGEHMQNKAAAEDEIARERKRRADKEMIEQAYYDVKYDRVPFSEKEKEIFKREAQKWGSKYKVKPPI